jgi:hypothetical protein
MHCLSGYWAGDPHNLASARKPVLDGATDAGAATDSSATTHATAGLLVLRQLGYQRTGWMLLREYLWSMCECSSDGILYTRGYQCLSSYVMRAGSCAARNHVAMCKPFGMAGVFVSSDKYQRHRCTDIQI